MEQLIPGDMGYLRRRLQLILSTADVPQIHHNAAMALAMLEHVGGDVDARVVALNEQWRGKRICTIDHTLPPSGNISDKLEPGKPFGGQGIAQYFYERGGRVWLVVEWGYEWVIEPTTNIIEVPEPNAGPSRDDPEPAPEPESEPT